MIHHFMGIKLSKSWVNVAEISGFFVVQFVQGGASELGRVHTKLGATEVQFHDWVYGRYTYTILYLMGLINQQTSLGGVLNGAYKPTNITYKLKLWGAPPCGKYC